MGSALPESGLETLDRLLSMALANPTVVAAVVAAAIGVAAGLYALRRFTRPAGARFLESIAGLDEVAILLHPNPDPDAKIGRASCRERV